jgi:hypothetical protein
MSNQDLIRFEAKEPSEQPLDADACLIALRACNGNVTEAAELLRVASSRLRAFAQASPPLAQAIAEAREGLVDRAEAVVREALHDPENAARRDSMAKFVLSSQFAERRGFSPRPAKVEVRAQGAFTIRWMNEDDVARLGDDGADSMMIEHQSGSLD